MIRNLYTRLALIVVIAAIAIWVSATREIQISNPVNNAVLFQKNVAPQLGLDLQGGLQVLLEADVPADQTPNSAEMETARAIVENRTNALGVSENLIQVAGDRRIVGEFPGVEDTNAILDIIQQTGLLEFVETGDFRPEEGSILETDFATGSSGTTTSPTSTPGTTPTAEGTPTSEATPAAEGTPTTTAPQTVYHTIMTGKDLKSVAVGLDRSSKPAIDFVLSPEGTKIFADYTAANIGKILAITLDKRVISAPSIQTTIPDGQGQITGSFDAESANALAVQLRYGSLPIPLKVVETRIIGPTLGEDSLQKSLVAGAIGMLIVILFMTIYYRMPGAAAVVSIILYGVILYAVFKLIGVTLTLPGIAGLMLSTGSALDANILVFERFKEELRSGRVLKQSFDQAWTRAWPSIRDSNIAALITAAILFWFGSSFGATIVKGFAVTLFLGVIISLFSSLFITRTLLALLLEWFKPEQRAYGRWFGL